jgi:CubicO group peptidase (beta-lactamase class C family)
MSTGLRPRGSGGLWERRVASLVITAASLAIAAAATESEGEDSIRVETKQGAKADAVHSEILRRVKDGFSGAVIVEEDQKIVLKAGYGWANRERRIPFTPRTIAQIGSLTKQFTATAIVDLSVRGKLDLSDPLGKFFPVPPASSAITLEQLLTHTSGLPDACGDDFERLTRDELVGRCLRKLENPPGKKFAYSNLGYSVLGAVVEKVSGEPLELFLSETFLRPLAMTDTGFFFPKAVHDRLAFGYAKNSMAPISDRLEQMDSAFWNLKGNGGMQSTAEDMERWHRALASGPVPSARVRQMLASPHARREDGIP